MYLTDFRVVAQNYNLWESEATKSQKLKDIPCYSDHLKFWNEKNAFEVNLVSKQHFGFVFDHKTFKASSLFLSVTLNERPQNALLFSKGLNSSEMRNSLS